MHPLGGQIYRQPNASNKMQATPNTIYKNQNGPVFSHLIILLAKQLAAIQADDQLRTKGMGVQL